MKSIALVVPYFGRLPYNMQLWLEGCRYNETIDFFLYTDDRTVYNYPPNVKVTYCSFDEIKERFQKLFDFPISLERAYKLCDYRVACGEAFEDILIGYGYWGYCDIDVLFGNIRGFITDDILGKFDKIGFQGHLTIYRNDKIVNKIYREKIDGVVCYREIFSNDASYLFDEDIIDGIYEKEGMEEQTSCRKMERNTRITKTILKLVVISLYWMARHKAGLRGCQNLILVVKKDIVDILGCRTM